ncbi:hypothetical protein PLESTF_000915000 [Pleodorina starrii]|nr:hypothetical protein PLESTM_000917400 [Pleodorina starrii]GLC70029.1 hypothetical protein PLESTF_000915000 [Pleodorina starrii]
MNTGKSSLLNALAQQEAGCVAEATPYPATDVKTVLLELHELGPVKLLDTVMSLELDEQLFDDLRRRKALDCLKECDVAVVVVDSDSLGRARSQPGYNPSSHLAWERHVVEQAPTYGGSPVLLLNIKPSSPGGPTPSPAEVEEMLAEAHKALDPAGKIPAMALDLDSIPQQQRSKRFAQVVKMGAQRSPRSLGLAPHGCLPKWLLRQGAMILMVIPMDAETPGGRLMRPQAMVQEEAIRHSVSVLSMRPDLDAARNKLGPEAYDAERYRFRRLIKLLQDNKAGPVLVVTDSQAVDVVHPWTLDPVTGSPLVPFTTFSICMAYSMSGGRLDSWVGGLEALEGLQEIPEKLEHITGGKRLRIDHTYGRKFPELESGQLGQYKVALHCGACMIDQQKVNQRLANLAEAHVPVTNYGMFFSYAAAPTSLRRALEPWGLEPPQLPLAATAVMPGCEGGAGCDGATRQGMEPLGAGRA